MTESTNDIVMIDQQTGTITTGLTEGQRKEVIDLLHGYWGADAAKTLTRDAAERAVDLKLEHSVRARVAALAENEAGLKWMIESLFHNSGRLVQSEGSKVFDDIIAALLKDEDSGAPAAIRQYVQTNIQYLAQRAVTEIVTAMVIDFLKSGSSAAALANVEMIRDAFMRARVSPGY